MGTAYSVKYMPGDAGYTVKEIKRVVDARLKKINSIMSTWDPESDISRINKAAAGIWMDLHPDLLMLLAFAFDLSEKTRGKYDVTTAPLINVWGFGPDGEKKIPTQQQIKNAMKISGYGKIDLRQKEKQLKKRFDGNCIDLSSIAKGYGVDVVAGILENFKIKNYMVEIGGEIRTRGYKKDKPWKIAIESPRPVKNRTYNKILNLTDCAVATSGDYRNFFESGEIRYSHTIDPESGRPVQNDLAGVSVVIPDGKCFKADAWATALMVSGREKGFELAVKFNIPAHFIYIEDGVLKEISTDLFIKTFL